MNLIKDLDPSGKIAVLLSNGIDSKVLHEMFKKLNIKVNTINLIRPDGRDLNIDADIKMELVKGSSEFQRVCETISKRILPYYDQVWGAENALPNLEWFQEHEDKPLRTSEKIVENFYSPFLDLDKVEIIKLSIDYNIDISNTISCTEYSDRHCRKCWFCREREYGYLKNNLEVVW